VKRIDRELNEFDDELDRVSPPALDTSVLQSQISNVQV